VSTLIYDLKVNNGSSPTINVGAHRTYFDISITNKNPIDTKYVLTFVPNATYITASMLEYFPDRDLPFGTIEAGETKNIRIRVFRNSWNTTDQVTFKVQGGLLQNDVEIPSNEIKVSVAATEYQENVLNGTDPVLTSNLVPVNISDNGTVTKASKYDAWYGYGQKRWANAIVLFDKSIVYKDGQVIPESNIQSYFVWIPRYRYQIFNIGNYTSSTSVEAKTQAINVAFENKNTAVSNGSSVNSWLTHPAFTSFNSNGFWVGKFESGYKGAGSTTGAEQNNNNYANLIIKPNVYSWRSITVGNAFKVSYDYLRSDDSHMMKNTEWGAVAYLQHSGYGSKSSVRVNNNSNYVTGYAASKEPTCGTTNSVSSSCNLIGTTSSVTSSYTTSTGYTASTMNNITGVYDMSGGAAEYVMGYNQYATTVGGESGLISLYSDFFTNNKWSKYYDRYSNNSTTRTAYNKRILGDATGEMGPFATLLNPDNTNQPRGSWYDDLANFTIKDNIWFRRGGGHSDGVKSGIFAFGTYYGSINTNTSFRVVLTPQ